MVSKHRKKSIYGSSHPHSRISTCALILFHKKSSNRVDDFTHEERNIFRKIMKIERVEEKRKETDQFDVDDK